MESVQLAFIGGIGNTEMIILLVIVLIIFGPKQLPKLMRSVGKSVNELKAGLSGIGDEDEEEKPASKPSRGAPGTEPRKTEAAEAQPVERQDSVETKEA